MKLSRKDARLGLNLKRYSSSIVEISIFSIIIVLCFRNWLRKPKPSTAATTRNRPRMWLPPHPTGIPNRPVVLTAGFGCKIVGYHVSFEIFQQKIAGRRLSNHEKRQKTVTRFPNCSERPSRWFATSFFRFSSIYLLFLTRKCDNVSFEFYRRRHLSGSSDVSTPSALEFDFLDDQKEKFAHFPGHRAEEVDEGGKYFVFETYNKKSGLYFVWNCFCNLFHKNIFYLP